MEKTAYRLEDKVVLGIFHELVKDILLERGQPSSPKDISPLLAERGCVLPRRLVKYLLLQGEELVSKEGLYDLAHRYQQPGRPLEGQMESILRAVGKPIPLSILAQEIALVERRVPQTLIEPLSALITRRPQKYFLLGEKVGLREWLLEIFPDEEDILFENFLPEDLPAIEEGMNRYLPLLEGRDLLDKIENLLRNALVPIPHKLLCLLLWKKEGNVEPLEIMGRMGEDGRFLMLKPASWTLREFLPLVVERLRQVQIPPGVLEPEPFVFGEEEKRAVDKFIQERGRVVISEILQSLFEMEDVDVGQAKSLLKEFIEGKSGLLRIGEEKWIKTEALPVDILGIPPEVAIDKSIQFQNLDGEELEVDLEDEGLEGNLAELIRNPLVQDVEDEEEIQGEVPPSPLLVLPYHHYLAGTLPVRSWEKSFYPGDLPIYLLTFRTEKGDWEVWYNRDVSLIYGLKEWFEKNLPPAGAIIRVEKEGSETFRLIWEGETHPQFSISQRRLSELLKLREELQESPTIEIIQEIMEYHKKAHFYTIFAEVNVIRRTTKRRVASLLSIYPCFYSREADTGVFHYDPAKRDETMKRAKKKYIITR